MVLLILTMVAPHCALAQSVEPVVPDTLENSVDKDIYDEDNYDDEHDFFEDDEDALIAAFDSLENMQATEFRDYLELPADTSQLQPINVLTDKDKAMLEASKHKIFIPDPQRALWLSLVIPGGGQIYNRKYWKLPIFYGGFLGCMYAFTWNQQMYMDYSQAYLDIMDDNPNTNSYIDMFPPSYDVEGNISRFQTVFKNRKDRYRRWRDLSTFCFIGVYALSIIDAYVDAHLSVFDISPDLSLQWGPTSIEGPHANIGLGASLHF